MKNPVTGILSWAHRIQVMIPIPPNKAVSQSVPESGRLSHYLLSNFLNYKRYPPAQSHKHQPAIRICRRRATQQLHHRLSAAAHAADNNAVVAIGVFVRRIRITGNFTFHQPHRLARVRLAAAKTKFKNMLKVSIIRQSENPWASPCPAWLRMSGLVTGAPAWQQGLEHRLPGSLPRPAAPSFFRHLIRKVCFFDGRPGVGPPSNLNRPGRRFGGGTYHLPNPFEFLRNVFQTLKTIRRGIPFANAYVGDILVAGTTSEVYMEHLETVFDHVQQFNVVFSPFQLTPGIGLTEMAAEQRRVGPPCDEDVPGLQFQKLPLAILAPFSVTPPPPLCPTIPSPRGFLPAQPLPTCE
nr:unnamed protein product [Spirometra erinaceieuropaei]